MPFDGEPKLKRDQGCTDCGLCRTAKHICLLGTGPRRANVMIIGEAPGQREDDSGTPFIGRSGALLDELLEDAGLSREDIYITNAVHCRPPDNRTPKRKEIAACKRWLDAEIASVRPQFILTLGNVPLESLLGVKGIRKHRGMPVEKNGIIIFPTYHPSYALRDERQKPVLASDIKMFAKIIDKGGIANEDGLNFRIITSWKDVAEAIADIEATEVIAIDSEDTQLEHFQPGFDVVSLGFGTKTTQWCFPMSHPAGWLTGNKWGLRKLVKLLDKTLEGKTLVMQNGKFDTLCMAARYGVWWYCDFDVMLAHYNLDENSPHDLGLLAQIYLDAIDYDIPLIEKQGKVFFDEPLLDAVVLNRHCQYLAMDVYYTRRLYYIFRKMLRADIDTKRLFEWLTMPVSRMYADMEFIGPWVDRPQLYSARKQYTEQAQRCFDELTKLTPKYADNKWYDKKKREWRTGINWGSPKQVAKLLFDDIGLEPLDETKGGENSTSESVLLRLRDKHPIPKLLLDWREAMKNLGFLDAWDKMAIENRLHPSFKVHGTTTGRPSCTDPNLQQTPRNPILRSCISAPPGYDLIDADQSQVEMRVATELSRDPVLMRIYQTGGDVHTATVQDVFGIMKPDKEQRKKGKAINFGFLFGMWWRKFIIYARDNYEVDFTEREAQEVRAGFFRKYASLPKWHTKQKRFANLHGYVKSLMGRKRRLPAAMRKDDTPECREAERQAINAPVQGFASDLTLAGALDLHGDYTNRPTHRGYRAPMFAKEIYRLVGTVHDSLLGESRKDMTQAVVVKIKAIMAWPSLLDKFGVQMEVPLVAEAAIGAWGKGLEV